MRPPKSKRCATTVCAEHEAAIIRESDDVNGDRTRAERDTGVVLEARLHWTRRLIRSGRLSGDIKLEQKDV